jgi:RNA polymerase sigma-70 factor (ECF subfamily)
MGIRIDPRAGGATMSASTHVSEPRRDSPEPTGLADAGNARDLAWLNRVARGDRQAFEQLYLAYHGRLTRFLNRHVARRELVDEIINEALWVVWRKAGDFHGDSKVATWIIGIAYRCMQKSLRANSAPRDPVADTATHAAGESDATEAEMREQRDWIGHGLALLPVEQRTTIELAYYLGQSCEEIAAIMDCATGTVKARQFHARVRLRNHLPALAGDTVPHAAAKRQE